MSKQILNSTEEFYVELIETFETSLINQGIEQTIAHDVAIKSAEHIQFELGGCSIYIPKSCAKKSLLTNAKIISEFTGNNQEALAIKYSYSISSIYRIIREHHANKRQSK